MLEPEGDSCNVEHCEIVLGALFILSGDPAELFEAVEQALHAIASSISLSVKAATAVLIGFGGDYRPDPARAQMIAGGLARKGLVSHHFQVAA